MVKVPTTLRSILRSIYAEPIVFLYMVGLYYFIPAVSSLYLYKVCNTKYNFNASFCTDLVNANFSNDSRAAEDLVSQETSRWLFYQTIIFVIPSAIVGLGLGVYSDLRGNRRLAMGMPIFGFILGCIFYICMAKFSEVNLNFMLFGATITGLSGGFATLIMAAFSHVSATASEEYRTLRLTIIQAVMSLGNVLGSFTVGLVLGTENVVDGWVKCFSIVICLLVVCMLFTVIGYYYTDHPSNALPRPAKVRFQPLTQAKMILKTVCGSCPGTLQLCLAIIMLLWVVGLGKFDVLYTFAQRMGLDRTITGYYTGYDALVQSGVGITMAYVFKNKLRMSDTMMSIIGIISAICCSLLLGFSGIAQTFQGFSILWWMSPVIGGFQMLPGTGLRSVASSLVDKSSQSQLFSFISCTDAVLQIVTSGIFQYGLWPVTEKDLPSLSFFVTSVLTTISLVLTIWLHKILQRRSDYDHEPLVSEG